MIPGTKPEDLCSKRLTTSVLRFDVSMGGFKSSVPELRTKLDVSQPRVFAVFMHEHGGSGVRALFW